MRDRWDQLSDANREDSVLSEDAVTMALVNSAERLQYWIGDRQRRLAGAASVWMHLDAFLDDLGASRDELFAAVCSQVNPQLSAEVNANTDSTKNTDVREEATNADEPGYTNMTIDVEFLTRLHEWSTKTFGGQRPAGILDHLRKEVEEIAEDPTDLGEWVDAILLALDGAMSTGRTPTEVIAAVRWKMAVNEARDWPAPDPANADKAVEHIRGDAPSKAHDRVRVFLDVWKGWGSSVSHSIVWTGTKYGEPGHPLLHLEDLEQVLVDLESQQPVEEINEATVVVLTAIEGNVALAAEVLNVVDAYPTTREAADSTRDHIDDAVEFMSDLPKTMTGLDSTDPAITLLDVNLDDVDWIKVAETVLGWSEL